MKPINYTPVVVISLLFVVTCLMGCCTPPAPPAPLVDIDAMNAADQAELGRQAAEGK